MSDYARIKRLDEESLRKLEEGSGPADECLCDILGPSEGKKGFAASVKKAFGTLTKGRKEREKKKSEVRGRLETGQRGVDVPLTFTKNSAGIYTTKEVVKRQVSCGKCGCDNEKIVLKHSYANIRITTPDVSSICPCPSDCLPGKEKLQNNIKVVVENARVNSSPNKKA